MGAQSSLLTLVGATGLGVSKVADVAMDAAKSLEKEEEPVQAKKQEVKKVDEDKEALKQADMILKKADAEEKLDKLKGEYKESNAELQQWKKGMVDVGNGTYMQTNDDLSQDIKMRRKSLKIMKEKIKARKMQLDTYKKLLGGKK